MSKKLVIPPFVAGLLLVSAVATGQTDKTAELVAKKLADPATYDLDPAEWFNAIDGNAQSKGEILREYFVSKHHTKESDAVLVWVYVETLSYSAPAQLSREHWRIACADEKVGVDTTIDADGRARIIKSPVMVPIPPDSVAKSVAEKACSTR
jgi:hypothetical protein